MDGVSSRGMDGMKTGSNSLEELAEVETGRVAESSTRRMDNQILKLEKRWKKTEFEVVLGPISELRTLSEDCKDVVDNIMEWMVNNNESRLVEEAEDMIDGLEEMTATKEMSMTEEVLMKATEIITAIVVARNMDLGKVPSFQKAGEPSQSFQLDGKRTRRVGRGESMKRIRDELAKMTNRRKQEGVRATTENDFGEIVVKETTRKEMANRRPNSFLSSAEVSNKCIQDSAQRMVVVGTDVEALYPSLEAVEVANIVFRAVQESDVKFDGVNYTEACR